MLEHERNRSEAAVMWRHGWRAVVPPHTRVHIPYTNSYSIIINVRLQRNDDL